MQGAVVVRDDDTPDTLSTRILGVEHRIYPEALKLLAKDLVRLEGDLCRTSSVEQADHSLIWPMVS